MLFDEREQRFTNRLLCVLISKDKIKKKHLKYCKMLRFIDFLAHVLLRRI